MLFMSSVENFAQITRTLSYQGILADTLGMPKPDGQYSITFRLYDVASGGSALWTELKTLAVKRGLFSTTLGDQVVFGSNLSFDKQYWLGIKVGAEAELSPRIPLSAVGYSINSLKADTARYSQTGGSCEWARVGSNINYSSGSVGIGTQTPSGDVHLHSTSASGTQLWIENASAGGRGWNIYSSGSANAVGSGKLVIRDVRASFPANDRVTIDSIGNVGIGSTFPSAKLDVAGLVRMTGFNLSIGAANGYVLTSNATGVGTWQAAPTGNINGSGTVNYLPKFVASTSLGNSALSETAGNVNIGRVSPNTRSRLFVSADDMTGNPTYYAIRGEDTTHDGGYGGYFLGRWRGLTGFAQAAVGDASSRNYTGIEGIADGRGGSANTGYGVHSVSANAKYNYGILAEGQGGTTAYGIYSTATSATTNYAAYFSGNVIYTGTIGTPSDSRFKEKLTSIDGIISKLMQLKPYSYEYSSSSEFKRMNFATGKHFGLIAQDVEKIFPELVTSNVHFAPSGRDNDLQTEPPIQYKGVNYLEIIPMLLSALQSQQAQIEKLQTRVEELSNRK